MEYEVVPRIILYLTSILQRTYIHIPLYLTLDQCQRREGVQSYKVLSDLAVIQQSTQLWV